MALSIIENTEIEISDISYNKVLGIGHSYNCIINGLESHICDVVINKILVNSSLINAEAIKKISNQRLADL